jgi:hypothetical protein
VAEEPSPELVDACGKASEALEYIIRVRGHLYSAHQLTGRADFLFEEAADLLEQAGQAEDAARLRDEVVGRNLLDGRWTFQIVEEFDDGYWTHFRELEAAVRDDLQAGRRHLREAGMKEDHRTRGEPGHESRP